MTWPSSASARRVRRPSINSPGAGSGRSGSIASHRRTSTVRPTGTRASPARRSARARRTRRWCSGRTRSGESSRPRPAQDLLTQCGGLDPRGRRWRRRPAIIATSSWRAPSPARADTGSRTSCSSAADIKHALPAVRARRRPSPPTTSRRPGLSARSAASARSSRSPHRLGADIRRDERVLGRRAFEQWGAGAHRPRGRSMRSAWSWRWGAWVRDFVGAEQLQLFNVYRQVLTWFELRPDAGRPHTGCDAGVHLGPAGRQRLLRVPGDRRDARDQGRGREARHPDRALTRRRSRSTPTSRAHLYDVADQVPASWSVIAMRPSGALPLHGHAGRELRHRRAPGSRRRAPRIAVLGARVQALSRSSARRSRSA